MQFRKLPCLSYFALICFLILPTIMFGQHPQEEATANPEHSNITVLIFEWIEYLADLVGIGILVIGFIKGSILFVRLEIDRLLGKKNHEEIFSLRNVLGSYIIIALDFLIVSDIIHSVVNPQLDDLLNLGIIVILRTAIGFFLGKELYELRKELKAEENDDLTH